jgi:hypothetical protein
MSMNEDELERLADESRKQADRANYPHEPTPLHEKAPPTGANESSPTSSAEDQPESGHDPEEDNEKS